MKTECKMFYRHRNTFLRCVSPVSITGVFILLLIHWPNTIDGQEMSSTDSLQFFAIGDWGGINITPYTTNVERAIAKEMGKMADRLKPKFILALGDNFYTLGVKNVDDKRFKETFEDVFTAPSLNVSWYFCAGNHDHYGNVSAEIEYSKKSTRWNFPDYNYTKIWEIPGAHKSVQVVMIDTVILCGSSGLDNELGQPNGSRFPKIAAQQWAWIEETLSKSTADYLLVAGHFPVWSIAEHGPTECLVEQLKPLLEKYQVTAYLCGHDHNLQHLDEGTDVQYIVTGCSNYVNNSTAHSESVPKNSSKFFWADNSKLGGFATFEATPEYMDMTFVDSTGNSLYSIQLKPRHLDRNAFA